MNAADKCTTGHRSRVRVPPGTGSSPEDRAPGTPISSLDVTTDPLAPLAELPGVRDAAVSAGDALAAVHRHPVNLRGWTNTATEASWRAARLSAAIDGADVELRRDGDLADPLLAGAMRVAQALDGDALSGSVAIWTRAPRQALARLHVLAAADYDIDTDDLGRPRPDPGVGERLDLLSQLVTGGTSVPAPILAGVVHGELLALQAFGATSGVIARAASRLVAASTGLDPHNLGVPEVAWFKERGRYREAAAGFASGDADAIAAWLIMCARAFETGAAEARSIADAAR